MYNNIFIPKVHFIDPDNMDDLIITSDDIFIRTKPFDEPLDHYNPFSSDSFISSIPFDNDDDCTDIMELLNTIKN
jgi:hypothetical protein